MGEERPIEDETLASILENETLRWGNGGVHKTQEEMNLNVVVFDFGHIRMKTNLKNYFQSISLEAYSKNDRILPSN